VFLTSHELPRLRPVRGLFVWKSAQYRSTTSHSNRRYSDESTILGNLHPKSNTSLMLGALPQGEIALSAVQSLKTK
jgi:hypothetical protein